MVIPDIRVISLFGNIQNLIQGINQEQPVKFSFYEEGIDLEEDFNENMQLDLYRMVQQQLHNIITHADATHAVIRLIKHENKIVLLISDNGKGTIIYPEKKGVGIINIISRAELYNGVVSINTEPGKGFILNVVFPCITGNL